MPVTERRGYGAVIARELVDEIVERERVDAGANALRDFVEQLAREPADRAHVLDLVLREQRNRTAAPAARLLLLLFASA